MNTASDSRISRRAGYALLSMVSVVALLLATGCTIVIEPEETGRLEVTLEPLDTPHAISVLPEGITPMMSPPPSLEAAETLFPPSGELSRAWVRADKILFQLYKGSTLSFSAWKYVNASISSISTLGTYTIPDIPAGSYTSLKVSIYNDVAGSSAVTEGWASGMVITDGLTSAARVNCIPVLVVDLTENQYSSSASLSLHGEKWYRAYTSIGTTTFFINRISGSLDLYVFDSEGRFVGNEASTAMGSKSKVFSTPGTTYYLALFGYGAGTAEVGFQNGGVL